MYAVDFSFFLLSVIFFSLAKKIPLTKQQDRHQKSWAANESVLSCEAHAMIQRDYQHRWWASIFHCFLRVHFSSRSRPRRSSIRSSKQHITSGSIRTHRLFVRRLFPRVYRNRRVKRMYEQISVFIMNRFHLVISFFSWYLCCDEDGHANCVHEKKEKEKSEINKHDF